MTAILYSKDKLATELAIKIGLDYDHTYVVHPRAKFPENADYLILLAFQNLDKRTMSRFVKSKVKKKIVFAHKDVKLPLFLENCQYFFFKDTDDLLHIMKHIISGKAKKGFSNLEEYDVAHLIIVLFAASYIIKNHLTKNLTTL